LRAVLSILFASMDQAAPVQVLSQPPIVYHHSLFIILGIVLRVQMDLGRRPNPCHCRNADRVWQAASARECPLSSVFRIYLRSVLPSVPADARIVSTVSFAGRLRMLDRSRAAMGIFPMERLRSAGSESRELGAELLQPFVRGSLAGHAFRSGETVAERSWTRGGSKAALARGCPVGRVARFRLHARRAVVPRAAGRSSLPHAAVRRHMEPIHMVDGIRAPACCVNCGT